MSDIIEQLKFEINQTESIMSETKKSEAGKGDKPRNCFSKKYRDNYDYIFRRKPQTEERPPVIKQLEGVWKTRNKK